MYVGGTADIAGAELGLNSDDSFSRMNGSSFLVRHEFERYGRTDRCATANANGYIAWRSVEKSSIQETNLIYSSNGVSQGSRLRPSGGFGEAERLDVRIVAASTPRPAFHRPRAGRDHRHHISTQFAFFALPLRRFGFTASSQTRSALRGKNTNTPGDTYKQPGSPRRIRSSDSAVSTPNILGTDDRMPDQHPLAPTDILPQATHLGRLDFIRHRDALDHLVSPRSLCV